MPVTGTSVSRDSGLPPIRRSFTQHVGRGIVGTLDAPGNFTRSILTGEITNAFKTITPFVDSERIPGSRLTGSDNPFLNLVVEVGLVASIRLRKNNPSQCGYC